MLVLVIVSLLVSMVVSSWLLSFHQKYYSLYERPKLVAVLVLMAHSHHILVIYDFRLWVSSGCSADEQYPTCASRFKNFYSGKYTCQNGKIVVTNARYNTVHNLHSSSRTPVVLCCASIWFEIDRPLNTKWLREGDVGVQNDSTDDVWTA